MYVAEHRDGRVDFREFLDDDDGTCERSIRSTMFARGFNPHKLEGDVTSVR
jgi:hypothetical protein